MKNLLLLFLSTLCSFSIYAQSENPAIQVETIGKGEPVLLIPGFTVPGESWNFVVEQLSKKNECHIVTLAGFGGKEPIEFPWLPKIREALEEYIQVNELQNLTVIGHSLGGTLAIWLASREQLNLSKMILVDALPATGALMFPNFKPENLTYDNPFNNQQLAMDMASFENLAGNMSKGMSVDSVTQLKIKGWMLEADRKTYVYGYTDYLKMDLREELNNVSIPVLILAADKPYGKAMVEQTYSNQYANLVAYDLRIAKNSAHFVMFDKPDWFMEQVMNFLPTKK